MIACARVWWCRGRARARVGALAVVVAGLFVVGLSDIAVAGPVWSINSLADTTVAPNGTLDYLVETRNTGDAATNGSQINVVASLPTGMTVVSARLGDVGSGRAITCFDSRDGSSPVFGARGVVCPNDAVVAAREGSGSLQKLSLTVSVDPSARGVLTAAFGVSGGGAPSASTVDPTTVSSTPPGFGVDAFDGFYGDAAGGPLTQAGGHPAAASVSLDFNTITNPTLPFFGSVWPVEPIKDVLTDLPAGLVGNPTAADQCTLTQLANTNGGSLQAQPLCPATSQVGTTLVRLKGGGLGLGGPDEVGPLPVYNLVPPPGVPAAFGFNVFGSVILLDASVRTGGDYGITITAQNLPEALAIIGTTVTFWGVPADPVHDSQRACPGNEAPFDGGPSCPSGAPLKAFLRLPTSCSASGLVTSTRVDSWTHPGVFLPPVRWVTHALPGYPAAPGDQGPPVAITGCDRVPFDPTFGMQPEPAQAGSPVGFAFDLGLPQSDDPAVTAEADLKTATVTLPAGVRVNPSSADGLQGCSPDQIALTSATAPACPDASKIGTVTINTPLLRDPVTGGIYLATPFDNPSNSLIALYLTASADGVVIKLAGQGTLDATTGQITTTFDNNPQTPFTRLHLELKGGPRAPLSLPDHCGTYVGHVELVGWNGARASFDPRFTVDQNADGQPCPAAFAPGFSASTLSNQAGSSSSFLLRLTRGDADQDLDQLTVLMPGGLTGRIASVPLCPDAQAAAGTCPEASRIGDVTTGAGAGSNPFFITAGRAYLTGPYKGAPFGVSIVVPAVAGPFNLGNVVVQSALFVDKHTADVSIVSDPLPTILQGIPLDVRDVRVNVDRSGFFLNPTSCAKKTIFGVVQSTEGAIAHVSDRFQAAECANLGFAPRMVLTVGGRGHTEAGRTTPLSTTLTMPSRGQANIRYVRVTLPTTINARLTVIENACTRAEFETDIAKCAHAKAGTASAVTPLLAHALRGNVYFVRNGHPIPDLFVALRGQVAFDLIGRISIVNSRLLRTTFPTAPDVPIRSFTLRLLGDSTHGSIGTLANLCTARSRTAKAQVDYIGQNGKVLQSAQALRVTGCPPPRRRKHA